jgi:hypothetical protein
MATITAAVTGTITTDLPFLDSADHAGLFGPAGMSLIGQAFTVNWTGDPLRLLAAMVQ